VLVVAGGAWRVQSKQQTAMSKQGAICWFCFHGFALIFESLDL
jgi:hypothetical protein